MFSFGKIVVIWAVFIAISNTEITELNGQVEQTFPVEDDEDTLVLLHVLFRHGNRTANGPEELYPKDPYVNEKYFPFGLGQLTNAGKRRQYSVGTALRQRYEQFLGKYYYPDIIEAYSTDYNRTKMSLQLVLAGLFPPSDQHVWEDNLYWQPVPYNYLPKHQDKVLLGVLCPYYLELYDKVTASTEMQAQFQEHKEVLNYISEHTGLQANKFLDVYNLYFGISTEEEWGFTLPEWTKKVWPNIITNLAIKDYFLSMSTADMRKMATGYFLNKIIEDTKRKILSSQKDGRKIHLYSAHENNIAELLMSLDIFEPHVPNYGAYVTIEVHQIDKIFGIKIYYENHTGEGLKLLKIPNCEEFCPLEKFITLVQDYIPDDDLCGN